MTAAVVDDSPTVHSVHEARRPQLLASNVLTPSTLPARGKPLPRAPSVGDVSVNDFAVSLMYSSVMLTA